MFNYKALAAELLDLVPNHDRNVLQQAASDYCEGLRSEFPKLDADLLYDAAVRLLDCRQASEVVNG